MIARIIAEFVLIMFASTSISAPSASAAADVTARYLSSGSECGKGGVPGLSCRELERAPCPRKGVPSGSSAGGQEALPHGFPPLPQKSAAVRSPRRRSYPGHAQVANLKCITSPSATT